MKILVTGSAGFIGSALSIQLLSNNFKVVGIDNLNQYYDPHLKQNRLLRHKNHNHYVHYDTDFTIKESLNEIFEKEKPQIVVHLAAQAGIRYSFQNPDSYIKNNINGFLNILENCKNYKVKHLLYASSSSIYGSNSAPFLENDKTDFPISIYAVTKKADELLAHCYSYNYQLPTTGLRFFTVYGPWGRPDMSYFKFTKAILENKEIEVFNHGKHLRDFTYIDDVVNALEKIIHQTKIVDSKKDAPFGEIYRIFNIGNNKPVNLLRYIEAFENALNKKANKTYISKQLGDIEDTWANIDSIKKLIDFNPKISIDAGVKNFTEWYINYYKIYK